MPDQNASRKVAILLFLTFKAKYVRNLYADRPVHAYMRELRRIQWFLRTARLKNVSLPIYVVVGGERNRTAEASLVELGAGILDTQLITPPIWASSFHKLSFNKISALSFTQFDKVVVMDNDIAVQSNFDEIATAETPGLVWHPAAPYMLKTGELCSVTSGLMVLRPSMAEFERATAHLYGMYQDSKRRNYDGGDQEFWRSFYLKPFELPIRFQATNYLKMSLPQWKKIHVMHFIRGFKAYDRRVPSFIRDTMKYQM